MNISKEMNLCASSWMMLSELQLMGNIKDKLYGYKFTINDRSAFYDWYNGYLEVQFQLQKTADAAGYAAADRITTINGSHSLIKHLTIRSAGKIIYDTDNLHKVCFVKNLLEYSDDFSRSVAKNSFLVFGYQCNNHQHECRI